MQLGVMPWPQYRLEMVNDPLVGLSRQFCCFSQTYTAPNSVLGRKQGVREGHQLASTPQYVPVLVAVAGWADDIDDREGQERKGAAVLAASERGLLHDLHHELPRVYVGYAQTTGRELEA